MVQADFDYQAAASKHSATISIFSDRPHLQDEIEGDLLGTGLQITGAGDLEAMLAGDAEPLGDVVLLDCAHVDARRMAAFAQLDMRIARSSAELIISTSMAALDAVFAAFDQSNPQFLVDASRAERLVAIGQALGGASGARVRELGDEDRLMRVRLAQQVESLAHRLDGYVAGHSINDAGDRLGEAGQAFKGFGDKAGQSNGGKRPSLPDPRLVRQLIRHRQRRGKFFDPALFADPAWDMLLDLTAARGEGKEVAVTSLCIASGVPATTALRWIKQLVDLGLFLRIEDRNDKRRAFIMLSDKGADAMAGYFAGLDLEGLAIAA